jgi:hypothetical protein
VAVRGLGLIAIALVVGACSSAPAPVVLPTPTPGATPAAATDVPAQPTPTVAAATPVDSGGPSASATPEVTSMTVIRTADCNGDNGTGTVGLIRITWTAAGTDGVRISIDPPSPDMAYGYGFADYAATGTADVPFACDPPTTDAKGAYHLYVVTTLHAKGYYAWRYAKVYQAP